MPPDPCKVARSLPDAQTYADVHRDYEVKLYPDGRLIFTCARCRLVFDRDDFAPAHDLVAALNAHKASHGPPSAQARAYRAARAARQRGVDAAERHEQTKLVLWSVDE